MSLQVTCKEDQGIRLISSIALGVILALGCGSTASSKPSPNGGGTGGSGPGTGGNSATGGAVGTGGSVGTGGASGSAGHAGTGGGALGAAGGSVGGNGGAGGAAGAVGNGGLVNGDFETPVIAAASFLDFGPGAEPPGFAWTVVTNTVDLISKGVLGTTGLTYSGNQAVDLVGYGSTGGIKQSFTTVSGTTYNLAFAYCNNAVSTTSASASVVVKDESGTAFWSRMVAHDTSTLANCDWTLFADTFTAVGTTTTLEFDNVMGNNSGGIVIDAVTVSP